MQMLDHLNIVSLKHCFFSTTDKEEVYLNLVLEFVHETVYRIPRNYSKINQRMPLIYVKLYTYQICRALAYIHHGIGICHRDVKPQNLLVNPHTHQLKLYDFATAKVLSEPDRIVGELLQPGGYLKLIELGLEDCANEPIDAQKVFGRLCSLQRWEGYNTVLSLGSLEASAHMDQFLFSLVLPSCITLVSLFLCSCHLWCWPLNASVPFT